MKLQLKKALPVIFGIFIAILLSLIVSKERWLYLSLFGLPILVYISIKNPFFFPFGLYCFLIPFDSILAISNQTTGHTLTKLLGLLSIYVFLSKGMVEKKLVKPSISFIFCGLFVSYSILSIIWANRQDVIFERLPTALGLFLFYAMLSFYRLEEKEFEVTKNSIIYGAIAASILTIIIYHFMGLTYHSLYGKETLRASLIFGERETDPNQFAFSLLIPFSFILGNVIFSKKIGMRMLNLLFLSVLFYTFLIIGSMGTLLGVIAIIFTIYIYVLPLSKSKNYLLPVILVFVGISLFLAREILYTRISQAYISKGSERMEIWGTGLEALQHYWVLGAGLDNFPIIYKQFKPYAIWNKGPHNIYLSSFVECGIIGFFLLLLTIFSHMCLIKDRNPKTVILKVSLYGILVSSFFLDVLWRKSFWLMLMLIMMYRKCK